MTSNYFAAYVKFYAPSRCLYPGCISVLDQRFQNTDPARIETEESAEISLLPWTMREQQEGRGACGSCSDGSADRQQPLQW